MAEETLNLYQKLARIRKMTEVIQKNKAGYGYKYVTEDEILARVTAGMDKYGVSLIPRMVPGTTDVIPIHYIKRDVKTDKVGNPIVTEKSVDEYLITGQVEWQWVNDEAPGENIVVPWMIVGQQGDASQTFGSAWTYSSRYFLMKYFNIATSDDDPDNYKAKKAEATEQEQKELLKVVLAQIEKTINENVNDTNKDNVKKQILDAKVVVENGKASNKFTLIKDLETAQTYLKLLNSALGIKTDDSNKEE